MAGEGELLRYLMTDDEGTGAGSRAAALAQALRQKRQQGAVLQATGFRTLEPIGKSMVDEAGQQEQMAGAATNARLSRSIEAKKVASENQLRGAQAGELGPQADLGGESAKNYDAITRRREANGQWGLTPDPLLPGAFYVHNRRTNEVHYLKPGQLWGGPNGAPSSPTQRVPPQIAPGGSGGGQPATPQLQQPDPSSSAQAVLLEKLPAEVRGEHDKLVDSLQAFDIALKAVESHPRAFGATKDVTDFVPGEMLKNAVSTAQSNMRKPEDTKARVVVFQGAAEQIKAYAGARGFSPGERAMFNSLVPGARDNAKQIAAKLSAARELAARHLQTIRQTYLPQLYSKQPPAPQQGQLDPEAADLMRQYGGGQ